MLQNRFDSLASAQDLIRKARSIRIAANRASSTLAAQLIALATRYEAEAQTAPAEPRLGREAGATTIEYALVAAIIAAAIVSAVETLI